MVHARVENDEIALGPMSSSKLDAREIINLRTVGVLGIKFRRRHGAQSNLIVLDSGVDHVVMYHSSVR